MSEINVKGYRITRLQYCAQGFRNAFYIVYNSMMNKDKCESWGFEGDAMSVLGTSGCFAIELYLKFLMVIGTFDIVSISGNHCTGHSLAFLYDELNSRKPDFIKDLESEFNKIKYKGNYKDLKDFLYQIKDHFIDWRYAYDSENLTLNLNTLSDVLNFLENYSLNKFIPISEDIGKNTKNEPKDNQSMSINSFDDIKK